MLGRKSHPSPFEGRLERALVVGVRIAGAALKVDHRAFAQPSRRGQFGPRPSDADTRGATDLFRQHRLSQSYHNSC